MAETVESKENILTCVICLDLFKDPVTLNCKHSYCMACVSEWWNQLDRNKGVYSCPECSQTFSQRPVLSENTSLAELVQQMTSSKIQTTTPVKLTDELVSKLSAMGLRYSRLMVARGVSKL